MNKTRNIGLILNIQPSINIDNERVVLYIKPTISRIKETYIDKNNIKIPVIEEREIDSVLSLKSGEIGVLGGLMHNRTYSFKENTSFFSYIPILGYLFKKTKIGYEKIELVILIKATIID